MGESGSVPEYSVELRQIAVPNRIVLALCSQKLFTMPDDLSKTGKGDDIRINIHEMWELRDWAQKLNTTPERIKAAVGAVGPMVKDVKEWLRTH